MKMIWNSDDIAKVFNLDKTNFKGNALSFNSSNINPRDIFVALKGGNSDGHIYVKDAIEKGASFCIVDHIPDNISDIFFEKYKSLLLLVDNTFSALENMAIYKRNKYRESLGFSSDISSDAPKRNFVAITGSVGKTSVKEALKLAIDKNCHGSFTNFNNHIGMPISLASMPEDCLFGVFELGMNHKGEISKLSNILKPNVAIITNISMAHIGNFSSVIDIAEAKAEIFDGMKSDESATAILPIDSEYYGYLKQIAEKNSIKNILTFGSLENANSRLVSYAVDDENFAHAKYLVFDKKVELKTKVTGYHHAINNAAVLLCVSLLGLDINKCASNLEKVNNVDGRGDCFSAKVFGKSINIIDDSYNANPESVNASLLNFASLNFKNKVIVLSDMLELGENSAKYHEYLIDSALSVNANLIVTVGEMMRYLYEKIKSRSNGANKVTNILHFADYQELKSNINTILADNHTYLFKGSKGTKLKTIVESIKNNDI